MCTCIDTGCVSPVVQPSTWRVKNSAPAVDVTRRIIAHKFLFCQYNIQQVFGKFALDSLSPDGVSINCDVDWLPMANSHAQT